MDGAESGEVGGGRGCWIERDGRDKLLIREILLVGGLLFGRLFGILIWRGLEEVRLQLDRTEI